MFGLQVYVGVAPGKFEWRDVRPKDGEPYRYATREEADRMASLCYDADPSIVRVVQLLATKPKPHGE